MMVYRPPIIFYDIFGSPVPVPILHGERIYRDARKVSKVRYTLKPPRMRLMVGHHGIKVRQVFAQPCRKKARSLGLFPMLPSISEIIRLPPPPWKS